jgi:hypothetical protein
MIYQLLVRIISYEYLLIYSTVATAYSTHDASVPLCGRGRWCQVVGASMVYFRARSVRRTFRTANDRAPRAFLSESTYTSIHRFNSIDERSIRYMLTPRRTCRLAIPARPPPRRRPPGYAFTSVGLCDPAPPISKPPSPCNHVRGAGIAHFFLNENMLVAEVNGGTKRGW